MTMINATNVPVTLPPTTPQLTALERYGRSGGDLFGDLLKFSGKTGTWTAGAQGIEVPIGTQLVAIVPEMLAGYVKWSNGELEPVPCTSPDWIMRVQAMIAASCRLFTGNPAKSESCSRLPPSWICLPLQGRLRSSYRRLR
jgi:hypothetical protein